MADGGGEESFEGDSKNEEEVELDLAKCAKEFAQYCQVDVINEVTYPSKVSFWKYVHQTTVENEG